jgi:hypothetical protein
METFLGAILGLLGVTALYVGAFRVWTGSCAGGTGASPAAGAHPRAGRRARPRLRLADHLRRRSHIAP